MPPPASNSTLGLRFAGLAAAFLLLTGQASAEGCAPALADDPAAAPAGTEAAAVVAPAATREGVATAGSGPAPGKYGCSETITRFRNGGYEYDFEGRGFITLEAAGRYTDPFGVEGRFGVDAGTGETRFAGGALDQAVATPMEDEPDRYRVVIPTESGERRWTCSLGDA